MHVLLTLIGYAGLLIALSSWVEYLLKNPSDLRKAKRYLRTVKENREAFHAVMLCVPILLLMALGLIILLPGPIAAIVGAVLSLTKPLLWFLDARLSLFSPSEATRRAESLFNGADKDGDGFVTRKELEDYAKANPWFTDAYKSLFGTTLEEALSAMFDTADANQDDKLTREELHGYLARQMSRIRTVKVLTVAAICLLPLAFLFIPPSDGPPPSGDVVKNEKGKEGGDGKAAKNAAQ